MEAAQLRAIFPDFFEDNGHTVVPSASLIPHDPTLLFTIAGMVPFKPYFLGEEPPPHRARSRSRSASGRTTSRSSARRRGTDVLRDARELQLRRLLQGGRHPLRLGPRHRGLRARRRPHLGDGPHDRRRGRRDLARRHRAARRRIQRLGEENFWAMGETGPWGTDSEMLLDKGPAVRRRRRSGGRRRGAVHRVLEPRLHAVRPQRGRHVDDLPRKNIDTGAGLDRLLALLNGMDSIFETDLFAPLLETAHAPSTRTLRRDEATDVALRRIADHGRAMTMLVADGVLPDQRGSRLRAAPRRAPRGPRRAARRLGATGDPGARGRGGRDVRRRVPGAGEGPRPHRRGPRARGGAVRPDAAHRARRCSKRRSSTSSASVATVFPGEVAFRLHDTHGFPVELTEELAAERGWASTARGSTPR